MAAMQWAEKTQKKDPIPGLMAEARNMGVEVCAPSINHSGTGFTVENGKILFGLSAVKSVGSSAEEITNNAGYLFLSLIPIWVLFRKKPLLQYAGLAFCMSFILMGMKRGAILIGGVVVLYLIWQIIKNARGKQRVIVILLTAVLAVAGVYFVIDMMTSSDYFLQRLEATKEGNSSGRDSLYSFFWTYFTIKFRI